MATTSRSTPGVVDFVHYQGDTFRRSLILDLDVTGWEWEGELRRTADTDASPVEATFAFIEVGSKEISFSLTPVQTTTLTGRYVYDVEATLPGGDVFTIIAGSLTIEPEVTL